MTEATAVLFGRLIFGGVFAMAAAFKFLGMGATAGYIAAAGFPLPLLLAWIAAFFESALVIALWTGAFFSEAALLAAAYVLFLAFAFHGPSHWSDNQTEFGFFVDHFTFIAGLLFAAVHGPGSVLVARRSIIWRRNSGQDLSVGGSRLFRQWTTKLTASARRRGNGGIHLRDDPVISAAGRTDRPRDPLRPNVRGPRVMTRVARSPPTPAATFIELLVNVDRATYRSQQSPDD